MAVGVAFLRTSPERARGHLGVGEGQIVPMKPGNSGGGKLPDPYHVWGGQVLPGPQHGGQGSCYWHACKRGKEKVIGDEPDNTR